MTSNPTKLAILQHAYQGQVEQTLSYVIEMLGAAANEGANLALLQELVGLPYFCQAEDPKYFQYAEKLTGSLVSRFQTVARKLQMVIVLPVFEERAAGVYHNTVVVIESDGTIAGVYRKMHIPDDPGYYEKYYFSPGDLGFKPIDTHLGRLGILICWDQWYPEAARLLALAGADMILIPTAIGWDPSDDQNIQSSELAAWETIQKSHAIANHIPVAVCNRVQPESHTDGITTNFWGHSFFCQADGNSESTNSATAETILYANVSFNETQSLRNKWPFLRDRRIDAYEALQKRYLDQ